MSAKIIVFLPFVYLKFPYFILELRFLMRLSGLNDC